MMVLESSSYGAWFPSVREARKHGDYGAREPLGVARRLWMDQLKDEHFPRDTDLEAPSGMTSKMRVEHGTRGQSGQDMDLATLFMEGGKA
jgi:hypothetical protein